MSITKNAYICSVELITIKIISNEKAYFINHRAVV